MSHAMRNILNAVCSRSPPLRSPTKTQDPGIESLISLRRLPAFNLVRLDALDPSLDLTSLVQVSKDVIACYPASEVFAGTLRNRTVTIKAFRFFGPTENNKRRECFEKTVIPEFTSWASLKHENILPLYGYCYGLGHSISFVSPFVAGGTAPRYLEKHPDADRVLMCTQIANGLAYLQSRNIVHGDLKGTNVLIQPSNSGPISLICDFGLSRSLGVTGLTTVVHSSLPWMAKELILGMPVEWGDTECMPTFQSDIWAWAMTAYELFTGDHPYPRHRAPHTLVLAIANDVLPEFPGSPAVERGLSDQMWQLLQHCWRCDPAERPSTDELLQLLRA